MTQNMNMTSWEKTLNGTFLRKSIFKLTVSVGASRNHTWICMASNPESHLSTFLTGVTLTRDRKAINQ